MKKICVNIHDLRRNLSGKTEFEKAVLMVVFGIPKGKVSTYKRIAEKVGKPNAYRAVGNALHKNPLAPIIPCHRVVRSDGRIAGSSKEEIEGRRHLLEEEGVLLKGDRVKLCEEIIY
ncbi:MGMT family protein [Candidatus Bathyarchaeota archaeon]|nr:MGMT family protein [Candidatus Bathyarchaeota archaeon]